jgi:lipoprotein-releasing system ATP-binding protein
VQIGAQQTGIVTRRLVEEGDKVALARAKLARIGLEGFETRPVSQLSGGQQQRVAIARSLIMNPALVLADEPTGNLDRASGQQAFELMRQFNRELGTAFLLVTHEPGLAQRCDRTLTLEDGYLVNGNTSGETGSKGASTAMR